jgi:uncharacterized membrane protein
MIKKFNLNRLMIFLLIAAWVYFALGQIINVLISDTIFMMVLIMFFLIIVVIHGCKTLGVREFLVFFLIAYSIPLLYEYTGGLGFDGLVGCTVHYSDILGPKFFDKVPYIIPLTWAMLIYCAFTMTNIIFNRIGTTHKFEEKASLKWFFRILGMGIVSGLIMASLDLILDPVMVAIGAWSWSYHGSYYGIPLWNYEIWIEIPALTFVLFSAYLYKIKRKQIYIGGEKQSSYTLLVVVLYLTALIAYVIYAVYEQIIFVIFWAVMAMGSFAVITVIRFYRSYPKM